MNNQFGSPVKQQSRKLKEGDTSPAKGANSTKIIGRPMEIIKGKFHNVDVSGLNAFAKNLILITISMNFWAI